MKIRDAVQSGYTFLDLEADGAEQAIEVVSRELGKAAGVDPRTIMDALNEREKLGSTSVGNGFAIPHCKLPKLDSIIVALARFAGGVEFGNGKNHEPVRFFFVVLSPPDQPAEHLQVLSQIARILKNATLRDELVDAPDEVTAIAAIQRAGEMEGL